MVRETETGILLAVLALLLASIPAGADHVNPDEIIYVLAPDAIPAITEPGFDLDDSWLRTGDPVVGIEVNGDARAYPVAILNWHEIVDDIVGGVPVAVTFCPLCGTGITFERTLGDGAEIVLRVSGKLYKNDLVMYDTATGSLWTQILGEAIQGPYHGTRLRPLTTATMGWSEWEEIHPGTALLARPRDGDGRFLRDYSRDPYEGYADSTEVWFPQGNADATSGLHPKEYVLGVVVNGAPKAYPFRFLSEERVVNDAVGGAQIVVTFARDTARVFRSAGHTFSPMDDSRMRDGAGTTYDLLTGAADASGQDLAPVDSVESFWFAWFDFYPGTDIYRIGPVPASHPSSAAPAAAVVAGVGSLAAAMFLLWRSRGRLRRHPPGFPRDKLNTGRTRNGR